MARHRLRTLAWIFGLAGVPVPLCAQDTRDAPAAVEFNTDLLRSGGSVVDVSRFRLGRSVTPGVYRVDAFLNQVPVGRFDVRFVPGDGGAGVTPCLQPALLERLGVRLPAPTAAAPQDCLGVKDIHESATALHDDQEQRLHLGIPQASLVSGAHRTVPPDQLDGGITAGLLNYNANLFHLSGGGGAAQSRVYLGLRGGLNIGAWRLRHTGALFHSSPGERGYQRADTYVQTDLDRWRGQLTLGEGHTRGELFAPFRFRGLQIESDDRMLPETLAGFSPVVRGVARTNAKVTLRQGGQVVYDTVVAPGPFAIDDFVGLGRGADIEVTVLEADGSQQRFLVPYANVPLLRRAGSSHYSLSAGAVRDAPVGHPGFVQAALQHGVNDHITGYAGLNATAGHRAWLIGAALNTPWGGWGADLTRSRTAQAGGASEAGQAWRLSYNKAFEGSGTYLSIASQWWSRSGATQLMDALVLRQAGPLPVVERLRSQRQVQLSQRLPGLAGQIVFSGYHRRRWGGESETAYSWGYNTRWGQASVGLQLSRDAGSAGTTGGTRVLATVTLPLASDTRPQLLLATATSEPGGRKTLNTTLVGVGGVDDSLSYSLTAQHATGGAGQGRSSGLSANLGYRASAADLSASLGQFSGGQRQLALGASGAVLVHAGGLTASRPTGDTVGLVVAPDATGARVTSAQNQRVDAVGFVVVPYLTPYRYNTVELDPKGLPMDVELPASSQAVAPRAGAVVLVPFDTRVARAVFLRATRSDGSPVPFGALVRDDAGNEVGSVAQRGRVFVRVEKPEGRLEVRWGEGTEAACGLVYRLPPVGSSTTATPLEEIPLACLGSGSQP